MANYRDEALMIQTVLRETLPSTWDGKNCVLALKAANYFWKQSEWPGFWFEWEASRAVVERIGGRVGPTYGNTQFDLAMGHTWDLKAHSRDARGIITNDAQAIEDCVKAEGGLGFIIAAGTAVYDDGAFRVWHDALKGEMSTYSQRNRALGRPRRRRKSGFIDPEYQAIFLTRQSLSAGKAGGWIRVHRQGRNSNGQPRPPKYLLAVERIPKELFV